MPVHPNCLKMMAVSMTFLLAIPTFAQQPPAGDTLEIVIVEGEGALNNIKQRTAREAVVEVRDENHKPVAGALVTFAAPHQGASVSFVNGGNEITVVTGDSGRATVSGITPNNSAGKFEIRISASKDGRTGHAVMTVTNILGAAAGSAGGAAGGLSGKAIIAILVIAGAAAGIGIGVASNNGGSARPITPATPTTITLTPGTPSVVGPPH